jgi:enterochelin esterase family protein
MDAHYHLGPDSLIQQEVPKGKIDGPFTIPSEAYPGTQHTYWVYVPAQYDAARPTHLMVYNDGHAFMRPDGRIRAQNVMDNLIHRREIPVMLGVFINPGRTAEQPPASRREWGDRTGNRPDEYNSVNDLYARVVVDELLPALSSEYNVSDNPEHRGIGGTSSGGIAAFTVAWHRPNEFRKVFSFVGTYVNLGGRGGNRYPELVRQAEKKPLRIFLQDGRNDNRGMRRDGSYNQDRDWFYNNVQLAKALEEKDYDVNYIWGIGNHGQVQGGTLLPTILQWLWRDHAVSTDPNDTVERSFNTPETP